MGLRYFLWLAVVIGDVAIMSTSSYLIYTTGFFGLIFAALAFYAFHTTGGFDAWNPKKVKDWMKKAKILGL